MSDVETIIDRLRSRKGIEGYIICNGEDVVRRLPSMPPQTGDEFRKKMGILAQKARHVVRDNNPLHDLHYLRIRAAKQEIMVAVDDDFLVIVIQRWQHAA